MIKKSSTTFRSVVNTKYSVIHRSLHTNLLYKGTFFLYHPCNILNHVDQANCKTNIHLRYCQYILHLTDIYLRSYPHVSLIFTRHSPVILQV